MNKTLLLIAAAAGAYALLRPKSNAPLVSTATSTPTTGAASWTPTTPTTTAPAASSSLPSWVSTVVGGIETGISLYGTIKGALPHTAAPAAPVAAGSGIWAGPEQVLS